MVAFSGFKVAYCIFRFFILKFFEIQIVKSGKSASRLRQIVYYEIDLSFKSLILT